MTEQEQKSQRPRRVDTKDGIVLNTAFQALGGGQVNAALLLDRIEGGQGIGDVVGITPRMEKLLYQLAYQALHLNQKASAHKQFRVLCLLNGQCADYWLGLALSHERWPGGGAEVETALNCARDLEPDSPSVRLRLAEFYIWAQRLDLAAAEMDSYRTLDRAGHNPTLQEYAKRLDYALSLKHQSNSEGG